MSSSAWQQEPCVCFAGEQLVTQITAGFCCNMLVWQKQKSMPIIPVANMHHVKMAEENLSRRCYRLCWRLATTKTAKQHQFLTHAVWKSLCLCESLDPSESKSRDAAVSYFSCCDSSDPTSAVSSWKWRDFPEIMMESDEVHRKLCRSLVVCSRCHWWRSL